jgi:hypothetical protein
MACLTPAGLSGRARAVLLMADTVSGVEIAKRLGYTVVHVSRTDKPWPGRLRHPRARRPSAAVVRILWERDGGRCKYISSDGHRCEETRRVVPHHLDPWVLAGSPDTPEAYELRCSRHNDFEGRLYFGTRRRKGKGKVTGRARCTSGRRRTARDRSGLN